MILAIVNGRELSAFTDEPITAGSAGIPIQFRFSQDWEGLGKVAVFKGSNREADVLIFDDRCTVPQEILQEEGGFLVLGVYGTDGEGTVAIPTVWCQVDGILPGAALSGQGSEVPSATVTDQLLAAVNQAVEIAQSVRDDADAGEFMGPPGPRGLQGPVGPEYELTEQDKEDIAERAITFVTQAEYDALSPEQKASGTYWITDDQPSEPISIARIEQTRESQEPGGVNELTITRTDGVQSRFQVRNGVPGEKGDTGDTGPQGAQGIQGPAGPAGQGLPSGGTAGQVLTKQSGSNYDTSWSDAPSGLPLVTGSDNGKALLVENGAWVAGDHDYVVTFTKNGSTWTADKTVNELTSAYTAGKSLYAEVSGSIITSDASIRWFKLILPLSGYNSIYGFAFGASYISQSNFVVFATISYGSLTGIKVFTSTQKLGSYSKPSNGIPSSDLASAVQAALIPSGGTAGQVLMSDGNGGVYWGNPT